MAVRQTVCGVSAVGNSTAQSFQTAPLSGRFRILCRMWFRTRNPCIDTGITAFAMTDHANTPALFQFGNGRVNASARFRCGELTYLASDVEVAMVARKFAPALGMTTAEFKVKAGRR
jgi:hypothetical protein